MAKLFMGATIAFKTTLNKTGSTSTVIKSSLWLTTAVNEDEAVGFGMRCGLKDLPKSDGWIGHFVHRVEIDKDVMADILRDMKD